ncbi:hypothetical protein GCG54_00005213 [Colletotrichum gloeosporioides]|uniref:Uncharacterized protein n=1 Tax=Colletotrichum gloeosporioides TaxID=474922 RepID=A0A8H4C4S5_COLGL|nr:uncharacterized protein GCG54_00005213 [Colletotrichum gloeosporioides]KAF3797460.1 hypothetical protein GCG54_00005213 [Colletotrichum gloeosporioides]
MGHPPGCYHCFPSCLWNKRHRRPTNCTWTSASHFRQLQDNSRDQAKSTKAAIKILMPIYVARLKPQDFLVLSADAGFCATRFTGDPESLLNRGAGTPANGGNRIAAIIKGQKDAGAGKV